MFRVTCRIAIILIIVTAIIALRIAFDISKYNLLDIIESAQLEEVEVY